MRVMIIHNDATVSADIAKMLAGSYTEVEHDSLGAVARILSAAVVRRPFDVVVCELEMPGMAGREVAAALRHRVHEPIVVLVTQDPGALESYAPADRILLYPFGEHELLAAIGLAREARSAAKTRRMRVVAAP